MFAIQKVTRQAPQLAKLAGHQCRTLMATPPRVKISFTESMMHGAVFYIGVMALPLWIICHVREYNGHKGS